MLQVFDIIGPIMIGPSSSHTAGAVRIGKYARTILGREPVKAVIQFSGSFAKTYRGHGTDRAIIAGILNMDTDDDRIPESMDLAKTWGIEFSFEEEDIDDTHPNTALVYLEDLEGKCVTVQGSSIGGGNIIINKINETVVSLNGKADTLIITHDDVPGVVAEITRVITEYDANIHGLSLCRNYKGGQSVITVELDGDIPLDINEVISKLSHVISSTILKAI